MGISFCSDSTSVAAKSDLFDVYSFNSLNYQSERNEFILSISTLMSFISIVMNHSDSNMCLRYFHPWFLFMNLSNSYKSKHVTIPSQH